jgi:nucleoside-diphosphate-sugar epimerase
VIKVAVLGSNGYLGSYLVRQLTADGYLVLPVTRKDLNLTDFAEVGQWLKTNQPDAIVNCATAVSISNVRENTINYDDFRNNINIFLNFYHHSDFFTKFINIGSGAEFDKVNGVTRAVESDIIKSFPVETYGYSKNLISRLILEKDKFYTLRLFGCFDRSESEARLFHQLQIKDQINLQDKQFDYFSAQDFYKVVIYYLNNDVVHKDVNCVYQEKKLLSEVATMFKEYHNLSVQINVVGLDKNYSGSGDKLATLNIPLDGLEKSLKDYK